MSKLSTVLGFVAGAAIGSVVTWQLVKKKYADLAQEEIDSVKEAFSKQKASPIKKEPINEDKQELAEKAVNKPNLENYVKTSLTDFKNTLKENGYSSENKSVDKPYVISPDEFGELYDYETISLTYYSDGVLADDQDEIVDDIDEIVGVESLDHFGEYEDDSVFVRNDQKKCDYEILYDSRSYLDVVEQKPYLEDGPEE